jgi:hypothetical protein
MYQKKCGDVVQESQLESEPPLTGAKVTAMILIGKSDARDEKNFTSGQ